MKRLALVLLCGVLMTGCGKFGQKLLGVENGKQGQQGPKGDPGSGTRSVHTGTTTSQFHGVIVSSNSSVKPLIQVLVKKSGFSFYYEIPGIYNADLTANEPYYSYIDGSIVSVNNCPVGTEYIIIVVV